MRPRCSCPGRSAERRPYGSRRRHGPEREHERGHGREHERRQIPALLLTLLLTLLPTLLTAARAAAGAEDAPAAASRAAFLDSLPSLHPPAGEGAASPEGLALDAFGRLFVLDRGRGRINRRREDGVWLEFGSGEQGGARWPQITGIFARPGPDLLALDAAAGLLYRFDLDGRLRSTIGWRDDSGEVGSFQPADFGMTPSGELLLLDRDGGRLLLFDRTGRLVTDLASGLAGPSRPRSPSRLAVDERGTVYLLDPPGARILRITRQGGALPPWGYGDGSGAMGADALLAVRPEGSVVLASRRGTWVRLYNRDGALEHEWRREEPTRFPLTAAAAADTLLYLACPGEGRILRWRLPGGGDGGRDLRP